MKEWLFPVIIILLSYITLKAILNNNRLKNVKEKVIFINIFRFFIAVTICLIRHFNGNYLASLLYFCAAPTYFMDIPQIKLIPLPIRARHQKKQKSERTTIPVNLSLISNTFLLYPLLFELLSENRLNTRCVFLFMVGEVWFLVYPVLRFNRNRNFMLQFTELISYLGVSEALQGQFELANMLFATCAGIEFFNFVFCSIPKYWYANCLSGINFLCGLAAIISELLHLQVDKPEYYVLAWIIAGQFFDLFDGRAAERFGSTKNGEMFDDIADFTSFGIASGIMVSRCFKFTFGISTELSVLAGFFYVMDIAYRLIRFVVNKRKAGQKGGVRVFEGLPSPGTSALVLSITCLMESFIIRYESFCAVHLRHLFYAYTVMLLVVCLVTISHIPYAHFGRVFTNRKLFNPTLRSIVCVSYVYFLLLSITHKNMDYIVAYMATCLSLYVISPITMSKMYAKIRNYEKAVGATSEDEQTGDDENEKRD